jgi:hypothetical protein
MTSSDKHAPRVDDDLKHEIGSRAQTAPTTSRAQEQRDPTATENGDPQAASVPEPDSQARSDTDLQYSPAEIDDRSRLGRYLPRTAFPADKARLLKAAKAANAPDTVLNELGRLPEHQKFATAARVWAALGHDIDHRF